MVDIDDLKSNDQYIQLLVDISDIADKNGDDVNIPIGPTNCPSLSFIRAWGLIQRAVDIY